MNLPPEKMKITRPVNILLIEDNPGDVRLTQEAFKEAGIDVNLEVAMDGLKAIHMLKKQPPFEDQHIPDLILLDLNLPKLDGREVLEKIKSDQKLKMIPVVILSTSNAEQDVVNSYNLHVNCYLNKPVDFDSFFDMIKKIEDFWLRTAILPSVAI